MKSLLFVFLLLVPSVTLADYMSNSVSERALDVCHEMMDHRTQINRCITTVYTAQHFDMDAIEACFNMASLGHSQSANLCLEVIKDKVFSDTFSVDSCVEKARQGWSQTANQCLRSLTY